MVSHECLSAQIAEPCCRQTGVGEQVRSQRDSAAGGTAAQLSDRDTGDPLEDAPRDHQVSTAIGRRSAEEAAAPAQEVAPEGTAASLYAQAASKGGQRVAELAGDALAAGSAPLRSATMSIADHSVGLDADPEAEPAGRSHGAADPLAAFRNAQQRSVADSRAETQLPQTAAGSASAPGDLQSGLRTSEPKRQATIEGDQEPDMYLGTRQGGDQRGSDGGIPDGLAAGGVPQRLADGLLSRNAGGAAAAAVGAAAKGDASSAAAAAADPVEGLSEAAEGAEALNIGAAGAVTRGGSMAADSRDVDEASGEQLDKSDGPSLKGAGVGPHHIVVTDRGA